MEGKRLNTVCARLFYSDMMISCLCAAHEGVCVKVRGKIRVELILFFFFF